MDALQDFLKPEVIWLLVGIGLLVMEFVVPGLVIFFFGVGACVVAVTCMATEKLNLNGQLILFIVASVLSLVFLRTWLKGIFYGHVKAKQDMTTDMSDFAGQHAIVKEKIDRKLGGKVELNGTNWHAEADSEIAIGQTVEVTGKENLTLKVKPL